MARILVLVMALLAVQTKSAAAANPDAPMKVGIVGLVHGHIEFAFRGGSLAPAGGLLNRSDIQVVGIVEPDQRLFDSYAQRWHLPASMYFRSIQEMVSQVHPRAALVYTNIRDHRRVVEECAALGVHVMVEKPLAVSYEDALTIQNAAQRGGIHVLVNLETSWYPSNMETLDLLKQGALGPIVKTIFRDGHRGPKLIGTIGPEFISFLIDPKQNGAGALYDCGCYGANLMTWLMDGEAPQSVTAVTRQLQPDLYPDVDDEAEIILNYKNAVSIVQASWNWPFAVKQMDVYGRTGYAKTIDSDRLEIRRANETEGQMMKGPMLSSPHDDPLHYLAAVLNGEIPEGNSPSSLKNNITVSEILDAARQSARTGVSVKLPFKN
ncbi:MAG TPA: Gfo/Idh/MocA family oxidoreductase [Terriglobales bacterium]|nr:Gfo/Idh/MocA family oxidoreductase [Terriglobales bacterium]